MVRLPRNQKQTYWLNTMPQMWPSDLTLAMTLTMNFQGQIWNLLYLSQRWFDSHKMKSTHIEWTEGLHDHQIWPWPWPWKVRCKDLPDSDRGDFKCRCAVGSSIFSCDQAAQQMVFSVCLSVCPSVCLSVTPFSPCSHHRIIMKFSGVITMVKSDVHAKGQGQRSKVKVTEVNTQLSRFRTLTPVWIHIWQWNHAHSWKQHRRGALLFFKVIRQISRSHSSKNRRIWPRLGVSGL